MMLLVFHFLIDCSSAMTPVTAAPYSAAFSSAHVDFTIVVASVTMVARHRFSMIAFTIVNVRTVVSLLTLHRDEGHILHVPCGRSRMLLIVVQNLLLHHGILHTDCVFTLLHLVAPCETSGSVVKVGLSLCFIG